MAAGVVSLGHDVEKERLHVVIKSFVVQEKFGE